MSVRINGAERSTSLTLLGQSAELYDSFPAALVLDADANTTWHLTFLDQGATNDTGHLYFLDGVLTFQGGLGDIQLGNHLQALAAARGEGAVTGRGLIAGRNTSGDGAASYIMLERADGTDAFLWVDATGDLRIGPAAPTEDGSTVSDTSGTVVGSQS